MQLDAVLHLEKNNVLPIIHSPRHTDNDKKVDRIETVGKEGDRQPAEETEEMLWPNIGSRRLYTLRLVEKETAINSTVNIRCKQREQQANTRIGNSRTIIGEVPVDSEIAATIDILISTMEMLHVKSAQPIFSDIVLCGNFSPLSLSLALVDRT